MMRRMLWGAMAVMAVWGLVACGHKEETAAGVSVAAAPAPLPAQEMARQEATADSVRAGKADGGVAAEPGLPPVQRHIELRHSVGVEVPGNRLEAAWRGQLEACKPPACEVIAANIENRAGELAGASLALRIVPARAGSLLETLRGLGRLAQHQMSQNDRTNEVIDIQARLTNQKALRDRLRSLVASHQVAKVSDLLGVERELARVQGEIDSAEGQLRATLAVTEKVSFDIDFRIPASFSRPGSWEPLREAWDGMGATLAGSLAVLLYCLAGGLPWLVVGGFAVWVLRGLWRRCRARCAARKTG